MARTSLPKADKKTATPPDEAVCLYVHSVQVVEHLGRRRARVKASEFHPNIEVGGVNGMSIHYICDPWDTPTVGGYIGVTIKKFPQTNID